MSEEKNDEGAANRNSGEGILRLSPVIKNYRWGKRGESSLVARLVQNEIICATESYAELWIGSHPSGSASVGTESGMLGLDKLIEGNPEGIIGARSHARFGSVLPFLLKVLSIDQALSIQAHPDRRLAKELNLKDSKNYPDSNHKPEIAIALTEMQLLIGFLPWTEIQKTFRENPQLSLLLSDQESQLLRNVPKSDRQASPLIRSIYLAIVGSSADVRREAMGSLIEGIRQSPRHQRDRTLITFAEQYGIEDLGLPLSMLMNLVTISPGEAVFIGPNVLHAYLSGDIIECMANSDNVVRAGLTPKSRDLETLAVMLDFNETIVSPIRPRTALAKDPFLSYETPTEEFLIEIVRGTHKIKIDKKVGEFQLLFCLEGEMVLCLENCTQGFTKGESALVTAAGGDYRFELSHAYVVRVSLPFAAS